MATIRPPLRRNSFEAEPGAVFEPEDILAVSQAFDSVCRALEVDGDADARTVIATRIIELAGRGQRNPNLLRERLLREAHALEDLDA